MPIIFITARLKSADREVGRAFRDKKAIRLQGLISRRHLIDKEPPDFDFSFFVKQMRSSGIFPGLNAEAEEESSPNKNRHVPD